ncbi:MULTISPECIES: ester cyclase [Arenibacter]|uniref:ester cyclase n=1 Tax=Arenibacter TaxID=178469 RepID=UPI000A3CD3D0|nr:MULTISPECIES: ester cyclase [Arenibacter]
MEQVPPITIIATPRFRRVAVLFFLVCISHYLGIAQDKNLENNIQIYTQVWDKVLNNGEIDQINSQNFDTSITLITNPDSIVGIDKFKAYYQHFITGFSNISFSIVDIFGQDDKLVKHWNFTGTHTGDFFGIPATGNTVNINGVTLVKMRQGKIAQEQDFMDNMVFLQQLGIQSDPHNMTVVDSIYNSFSIGDIPTVLSLMDPNIVWNEAEGNSYADGNPYKGPQAVLDGIFTRIKEDHEFFKLADIQLYEMANNQVLATLRYRATLKKNGAPIDAQAAHLWSLKGRKIIRFQQFVDTKQLHEALGR